MKSKTWLSIWFTFVIIALLSIVGLVCKIDPYFHYHKPDTKSYYYSLDNQRSQNDGISKHFEYNALITGTSMTENFKTSEMDEMFGVNSIKVPFSGGSYKEINDNLAVALESNPELKTVIRCLDYGALMYDKDIMRTDLGKYPTYLYDKNPFNDVFYIYNRDVIFGRIYPMISNANKKTGITSFDDYAYWQPGYTFGINTVEPGGIFIAQAEKEIHLSEEEKNIIYGNITQNVTSLAQKYPDVNFYYFFSPYSAVWWSDLVSDGTIYKWIEAEQYVIELILEQKNIHLYSFNNRTDITTDLNNYKDTIHYGEWVNSLMLKWMHEGEYLLTKDNYLKYINEELLFYTNFDYNSLNNQVDYEWDYYVAALLNKELSGEEPLELLDSDEVMYKLSNAELVNNQYNGEKGVLCKGNLHRESDDATDLSDYILNSEYIGIKIDIADLGEHRYLSFYGKKISDHGQPTVYVYDANNIIIGTCTTSYQMVDDEWHQYLIDLQDADESVTIVFNGGYIDATGSANSQFVFSNIILY